MNTSAQNNGYTLFSNIKATLTVKFLIQNASSILQFHFETKNMACKYISFNIKRGIMVTI